MESLHDLAVHRLAKAEGRDPRLVFAQQRNQSQFQFQKVDKSKYLGPVPKDDGGLLELMVSLPCAEDSKIRIDQSDPTTRSKLAEIKLACEVWIEVDDDFVTILGRNKDKLKAALTELQTFIKRINKEIEGRMISLVEHSIATSRLPVEIKSITSDGAPYRPVTTTVHSEKIKCPAKDEKSTGGYQGLADELGEAIREAAKRIRPVEGELRVRMHMGLFSLQMRRANQDTFYDDEGFRKYLKKTSDKGWAYVGHRLGNETLAQRLLDVIYQTEDLSDLDACKFMGASATILSIRDIKPRYCLVLLAKGLRIEVDIKYEPGYHQEATVESIRGFHCARRDQVVEVAVSCPDRAFDWHLSVEAEANTSRLPPEIMTFVRLGLKLRRPASREDFLVTEVDDVLLRAAEINEIACKVSWTFEFTQKPYRLEVSVYHEWGSESLRTPSQQWRTLNTADVPGPTKSCGIMMYGQEWDEKMQEINKPGGPQSDFAIGFPELFHEGDLSLGIEDFLQEVQGLYELTELATIPDQHRDL
ncbi:hypothetical protein VSDG_06516 [Cytospora chrysosperma]|uniref:DUF7905 domain-containing protein n=1 Tax=Cytospora chrysosperma TaxID=252740 RepID=A0A423VL97_CYTCH|nr:hypothetical protein VSDG_06516 [Valsa sordida]